MGLSAPAVDAPPGPTGPPEDRGFARTLDRATAPPSEASPTQESPPPEAAVAEPPGAASHEAGTAASESTERPPTGTVVSSDTADDVGETTPLTSMPDRPAGAVEGGPDAVVLESSTLEAMMAAVLFRPAPVPQESDSTSVLSAASVTPMAHVAPVVPAMSPIREVEVQPASAEEPTAPTLDVTPALSGTSVPSTTDIVPPTASSSVTYVNVQTAVAADGTGAAIDVQTMANATSAAAALPQSSEDAVDESATTPEVDGEAVRVAAQAAARLTPMRAKGSGVASDSGVTSTFDAEVVQSTIGNSDDAAVSTATSPKGSAETASTPTGPSGGPSDIEAFEVVTSPSARGGAVTDSDAPASTAAGESSPRAVLMSGSMPMTDLATARSVAATKVSGVRSLPVATQVAETVRAAVMRGDHEIRLLLNPGDLGRIDIRITEHRGALQLRLDASHGSTREMLAREMPVLQQALESRDLRVERIQVSHSGSASADGSGAAWQQGSSRQGQQRERDGAPAWSPVAGLTSSERGHQEARRAPRVIRHHGVLDRVA